MDKRQAATTSVSLSDAEIGTISASNTSSLPVNSAASATPMPSITTVTLSNSLDGVRAACTGTYSTLAQSCAFVSSGVLEPVYFVSSTNTWTGAAGPTTQVEVNLVTGIDPNASSSSALPSSTSTSSAGVSIPSQSTSSASTDPSSSGSGTAELKSKTTGISAGAVAGAAIGGLVAGAVIAGFACFFLFKRRSKTSRNQVRNTYVPATGPAFGGEKGTPMVSVSSSGAFDYLPQQADDGEVQRRLSTVTDQIDQHVENFYGNWNVPLNATLEAELSRFETSQLHQPLAACFERAASPTTVIKHCLAFHVFNLTLAPGEGTQPLLPADLAVTVAAVYAKSLSSSASKDTIAAFSMWKALTKYLRPDLGREPAASRSTANDASRIAAHFTNVFSAWSDPQYPEEQRSRHLTELINHAVQTAVWLFGQPDTFRFDWNMPAHEARHNQGNTVVVVPAVFKASHDGVKLSGRGQNVVSPIVNRF